MNEHSHFHLWSMVTALAIILLITMFSLANQIEELQAAINQLREWENMHR